MSSESSSKSNFYDSPDDISRKTPLKFELTVGCTPNSREIYLIEKRGAEAYLTGLTSIDGEYDVPNYDFFREEENMITTDEGLFSEEGLILAQSFNEAEIDRLREEKKKLLAHTPNNELKSTPIKDTVLYYKNALGHYRVWFHNHNFPFPSHHGSEPSHELEGDRWAYRAYPKMDEANNVTELYRKLEDKSKEEVSEDIVKSFRLALQRAGYYVPDRDKSTRKKYDEMCKRIEDYRLYGKTPERP